MADRTSTWLRNPEAYWVSVLLALLTLLLAFGPIQFRSPVIIPDSISDSVTDITPVRMPLATPEYQVGAFTYRCSECHRTPTGQTAGHEFTKHSDIELAHGINTRCVNCHHPVNREAFVDDFGEEIPWQQPQLVCAKCHGPVYRDWQRGSHGRINGYWDRSQGEQVRLKCISCHDPHRPPFQPLASAPGPHTLRMDHEQTPPHSSARNPLRIPDSSPASDKAGNTHEGQGP